MVRVTGKAQGNAIKRQAGLQLIVATWNKNYPQGQLVAFEDVGIPASIRKPPIMTRTRTQAQVLSGHTPVIWLDGVSGCVALNCVTALEAIEPKDMTDE